MKVTFPISLKVTVWLILNLLLLGAAAIGFLVAQGGLSWDSLVAGAAGQRLHTLATAIATDVATANVAERDAVLARFASAYGADFILVRNRGGQLAGPRLDLPDDVRQRVDEGPPGLLEHGPGFGRRDERPLSPGLPEAPVGRGPRPTPRGRFVVRSAAGWWIGLRVPFPEPDGRPGPATLILRAHSLWGVMRLLSLESWLLVAATVLVLSVLFWLPLVRSITRQVRRLSHATEQIAEGRFETRVPANQRDELGRLGESVNTMAARLDAFVNGQKRFLADVAHELGSPIGRLQVATEILQSRAEPALQASVTDVREEVQQMAALVNELLAFTQAGLRAPDTVATSLDVDELFTQVLAREDPGKRVQASAAPGLQVLADKTLLIRAISNLIRNALRHAADSPAITLAARRENGSVVITVDDDGPGVPAGALARLGEPFYRPEAARTREGGGIGLGLAIVRTSVAACSGTVRFANRTPCGFRAELRVKAA